MITSPSTAWRAFLYGGGSALLLFNLFFMAKAAVQQNFVPLVPIIAGSLTAAGLLLIIYAEHRARKEDRRDHRRISRVATQLEAPLHTLQTELVKLKRHDLDTKTKILLENIRDLFLTLQAQEGTIAQEQTTFDLCALVREAVERTAALASARNITLEHKLHCQDAPVRVDKRLLLIALVHIIENAIFYTLAPNRVTVSVTRGAKQARVLVEDRGVGIKVEDEDIIFQPFARGHAADQFDPNGIGVGLTLSRLIIKEFGGKLSWHPNQDKPGTIFEIQLPLSTS